MAWTAPLTRATGDLVTATSWNADVRDNLREIWREVAYAQFTADVAITATTEGTAQDIVSAGAVTYDGNPVIIEFWCPFVTQNGTGNGVTAVLQDGATVLGQLGQIIPFLSGSVTATHPEKMERRLTPSAASHTYKITAFVSAGTGTIKAGAGGAGAYVPGYIRILCKGTS